MKGSLVRKLVLVGLVAALVLAASASGASADTWSGSCTFKGTETNLPPYTWVPANRSYIASGSGTCTGTLNGAAYKGPASVFIDGRMNAPMSCEAGVTQTSQVPGTLTFGSDPLRLSDPQVGLLVANVHTLMLDNFLVQGAYNGYGYAQWQLGVSADTLTKCLPQNGLVSLPFTLSLQTLKQLYG